MLVKPFFCLLLLTVLPMSLRGQTVIDWVNLANVTFEEMQDSSQIFTYNRATFGDELRQLAGQRVRITGYIIPMDPMGITYVLSRNPNATCFFCGGAGPETVLQLQFKTVGRKRYTTDDRLTFTGRLQLNEKDIDSLTYVLLEAEEG